MPRRSSRPEVGSGTDGPAEPKDFQLDEEERPALPDAKVVVAVVAVMFFVSVAAPETTTYFDVPETGEAESKIPKVPV